MTARYLVDVFEVTATDDPRMGRLARWRGQLWVCRIERWDGKRRDEIALEYGPTREDAYERARDYQRYVRDMERRHKLERARRIA